MILDKSLARRTYKKRFIIACGFQKIGLCHILRRGLYKLKYF